MVKKKILVIFHLYNKQDEENIDEIAYENSEKCGIKKGEFGSSH